VKYILASAVFAVLLLLGIWIIAIPGDRIANLTEHALDNADLHLEFSGFRKGFFYNFTADRISIKKNENTLILIDNLSGHINPAALLKLRLPLVFDGSLGNGTIKGEIDLLRKNRDITVRVDNAGTDQVPFFGFIGLNGVGILSGELRLKNNTGEIRFDLKDTKFTSGTFGNLTVPLDMLNSARGAMAINGNTLKVLSFALDGDGVYARVKGDVTDNRLNLVLELMPEKSFSDRNLVFTLLEKYRVSPGYFMVPLTNQLNY
jgi:type II secretion system protein N